MKAVSKLMFSGAAIAALVTAAPAAAQYYPNQGYGNQGYGNNNVVGSILNQILGGGGFASRLMEEVREKRGLAYSVHSYLNPMRNAGIFAGGVATKNEEMAQSLDVIRAEFKRMADSGPTQTEFDNAKSFMLGSYALRFDTNSKIASQLLGIAIEDLGIDYVDKRNKEVEAVSIEDVKRSAKRLLDNDDLLITIVGKPKGVVNKG